MKAPRYVVIFFATAITRCRMFGDETPISCCTFGQPLSSPFETAVFGAMLSEVALCFVLNLAAVASIRSHRTNVACTEQQKGWHGKNRVELCLHSGSSYISPFCLPASLFFVSSDGNNLSNHPAKGREEERGGRRTWHAARSARNDPSCCRWPFASASPSLLHLSLQKVIGLHEMFRPLIC